MTIIFATQDIERALGLSESVPSLAIACVHRNEIVHKIEKQIKHFFCLEDHSDISGILTTHDLLLHPKTQEFIKKTSKNVMVFKNISKIQKLAEKKGWNLINNNPKFLKLFEDKIEFALICEKIGVSTPTTLITRIGEISYKDIAKKVGKNFVVQFRRGHAGESTVFINSENECKELEKTKADYPAKITKFIKGQTLTYNICICKNQVRYSNLMAQINAYPDFIGHKGGTCGVDIEYAKKFKKYEKEIKKVVGKFAKYMQKEGYKGFLGVDFMFYKGKTYLIECNPRLTANLPLNNQVESMPLLASHVKEFLPKIALKKSSKKMGAYFILRNTSNKPVIIKNAPKSGKYKMSGEEFYMYHEKEGSLINPNMKLASIIAKKSVLTKNGKVKKYIYDLKSKFELKPVYIAPQDFWENTHALPIKACIDVFKKPLKSYAKLSEKARNRNRQTQCLQIEDTFELLGEYEDSYLIKKWDETYGWIDKKEAKKTDAKPIKIAPKTPKKHEIDEFIKKYIGTKYLWGGISRKGIDCSGLTQKYYLELFGIKLPKHSLDQLKHGKAVKNMRDNDAVFLKQKTSGQSHVGIFYEDKLLHASLSQKKVVQQALEDVKKEYEIIDVRRFVEN